MKRFYLNQNQFLTHTIDGDEFNHIKNVMRMNRGDEFIAFIGDEKDYSCTITEIKKDKLFFEVNGEKENLANPVIKIALFQALAKGEKMELVAQKTTEIGITDFYPLYTKNCDVKPNTTKPARLEKIVVSACKQCGRSRLPVIHEILKVSEAIDLLKSFDLVLFANEKESSSRIYDTLSANKKAKNIALVVGPEGGFTPEEIELFSSSATSVTFGKRILRTETASIYLTSIINDFYRN